MIHYYQINADLSEITERVDKNKLKSIQTFANSNFSNPFIAPSDGYVTVYHCFVTVYGSDTTSTSDNHFSIQTPTSGETTISCFIKKGMKLIKYSGTSDPYFTELT
jgi:hypothetical protein